jgi:hypothetical protein
MYRVQKNGYGLWVMLVFNSIRKIGYIPLITAQATIRTEFSELTNEFFRKSRRN